MRLLQACLHWVWGRQEIKRVQTSHFCPCKPRVSCFLRRTRVLFSFAARDAYGSKASSVAALVGCNVISSIPKTKTND